MALKDALKKLDEAVEDLTSLQVQTFTGTLESTVDSKEGFGNIEKTVAAARTEGKIKLVAEAYVKFDGDSYNFVSENIDDVPKLAVEIHKNAVAAGLENRQALLSLFKQFFLG